MVMRPIASRPIAWRPIAWLIWLLPAALLALMTIDAQAAPAGSPAALPRAGEAGRMASTIAYRHCWRRNGRTRCRISASRRGSERYEPAGRIERQPQYYTRFLPFGSQLWWQQQERESGDRF
jgi:hypothetical protein